MSTQQNPLGGNTQNLFAKSLLADASLLDGDTSLGITQKAASPLAAPSNVPASGSNLLTAQPLQQNPSAFSSNQSLASSLPINSTNNASDPLTGNPLARSVAATPLAASAAALATPNFSIMAEGKVTVNGGSDFDGLPLDLSDDALIYAGLGFKMNGSIVLPTQRNANGTIITDAAGKSVLVNNALTVGPNYNQSSISGGNNYAGLNPPPVLSGITVDVPDFATLKQQELTTRIPTGTPTIAFNATQNPTTTAALWNQKFPPGGTVTQPKVVQVTGALTIPTGVTISNTVIIVDSGNITLSGASHTLNNVTLIANNGSVILANAQAKDASILASGTVTMNGAARFDGKTLIANGTGNMTFNGATKQVDSTQDLTVVSQGNITYNGAQNSRGTFLAKGNFSFDGTTQLFGRVKAKGDITFNGGTTFTGIGGFVNDITPPTITAALSRDTAPNNATNTDKITNDPTIVGSVTDLGQIAEFKASLNAATGLISVSPQRLADGTFTLTKAQLTQINGGTLPDGPYTLNLQAKDQAGNISNIQYSFTLDTTVAVPTNLDLLATSDSGTSNTDNITKINTPIIAGKADAGSTVQLLNGAIVVGQATANATGDWQITTSSLSNGTVSLTAIASDVAGNLSVASAPIILTIDSVQPQVTLTTPTTSPLRDGAKLTGTINGTGSTIATVTYRFDSGTDKVLTTNANGAFDQAIDFTGIANGAHVVTIIATDVAGNVTTSIYNLTVTLDKDAPIIVGGLIQDTGTSGTDLITFNPAISGTVADFNAVTEFRAGFNATLPANFVNVLPQRLADGTFSFTRAQLETIYGGTLPQGASTLKLQAKDTLGNLSAVFSITFTFDSVLPQLTLTTPVNAPLKNNATLVGSLNGTGSALVSATYKIDNGTAIPITLTNGAFNQAINFAGVANGAHTLTIIATDAAGNVLTSANNITVAQDADAPVIAAQLVQDSGTSGTDKITFNPNISGTVLDANVVATFQAAIDTGSFVSILPERQADGSFSLTRTQLETVNGGTLLDGLHTVKLSAVDEFGNATTVVSIVFTLDTTVLPPNTLKLTAASDTGVSTTDNITQVNTPTITGLAEPNSTVQLFNGATLIGTATANGTGAWQVTTSALSNGTQILTAIATDVAGNISQPSTALSVTVDTLLPQLTVSTPVGQPLRDTARLTGSLDGTGSAMVSATYRFDTGTEIPITLSPTGSFDQAFNFAGIADGTHDLIITAVDQAGNLTTTTFSIIINLDATAPTVTAGLLQDTGISATDRVTNNPAIQGSLSDTSAIAEFTAKFVGQAGTVNVLADRNADGTFAFSRQRLEAINGGALADGTYTLQLQAKDQYGNTSQIFEINFVLDTALAVNFSLDPAFDSAPVGDGQTSNAVVSLQGVTDAGATVVLAQSNRTTTADNNGRFSFSTVTLVVGDNTFSITATDRAGNSQSSNLTIKRLVTNQAPTAINLSNNLVAENSVSGTAIGTLSTIDPDVADTHTYTLVDDASGRFRLVGNRLEVAPNAVLNFEAQNTYDVRIRTTDSASPNQFFERVFSINLTDVNEAPRFTSSPIVNAEIGAAYGYTIGTSDPENNPRSITVANLPSWLTLVDNGNGTASLAGTPNPTQTGLYTVALTVTDNGGLKSTQTFLLGVDLVLREGTNFSPTQSATFTTPDRPTILSFTIDPTFDTTDPLFINDAFEVALVDAQGKSLTHAIAPGRDSFFNFTEGEPVALAAGVTYNAVTKTVSINLTGIKAGDAKLVFRLVNDDADTTTQVKIRDISLVDAPLGTIAPVQAGAGTSAVATPISLAAFNSLSDISSSVQADYQKTSFNTKTGTLYTDIALRSIGSYSVDAPLIVVLQVNDPRVSVRNADGFTPEGLPYYNYSNLVADGRLDPNEISSVRSVAFYNPTQIQFSYKVQVLAQLNQRPIIDSQPSLEILQGKVYSYAVKATDPNGDALSYKLLTAPSGMVINSQTGVLTWNTAGISLGNQSILLQVSDGHGGVAEQSYNLSVVSPQPNRPPVFTSTPVVDAMVNKPYIYGSQAIDLDKDTLTYSLGAGPDGMKVDPVTGKVTWTPTAAVVFGDTVLARVNTPGEADVYTFSGIRGQRMYFDALKFTGIGDNWEIKIESPTGKSVFVGNLRSDSYGSTEKPFNLLETGNYRLSVREINGGTGAYGFSVVDLAVTPIAKLDENIVGTLSPGSEVDIYRFSANAGQRLYFDQLSVSSALTWEVYNADNVRVWTAPYGVWADGEYTVPFDGEYILVLRGTGDFTTKIPYTFRIVTPDDQKTALTLGNNSIATSISASIQEKGERDIYTFTAQSGQKVLLDIISGTVSGYSSVRMYSPSGKVLENYSNYYRDVRNTRGLFEGDTDLFTLTESGQYRLEIDGYDESTGAYQFNLLDANTAEVLAVNQPKLGHFDAGATHIYRINVTAGQRLYLDGITTNTGGWILYGPNDQQILSPTAFSSDIETPILTATGTYTLVLRNEGGAADYQLTVIPTATRDRGTLALDTVKSGNLTEKGAIDTYTFTGQKGERVAIDSFFSRADVNLGLKSPSGVLVVDNRTLNYGPGIFVLPEDGEYQVKIDGYQEAIGNYKFRILSGSNAELLTSGTPKVGQLSPKGAALYRLNVNAGDRLYMDSQSPSASGYWQLFDDSNSLVSSFPLSQDFETLLKTGGTYYLLLQGTYADTAPIDYTLQVIASSVGTSVLNLNTVLSSEITKLGEQDAYTFTGAIGQQLYFDAQVGNVDLEVKVYSPSGIEVFNGSTALDGKPFTLTEVGPYKVVVDGKTSATGTYAFRFSELPAASELPLGVSTGTQSLNGFETKLYKFTGNIGQKFLLHSLASTTNVDWVLYAPGNQEVRPAQVLSLDLDVMLPNTGTYWLAVRNLTAAATNFALERTPVGVLTVTPSGFSTPIIGTVSYGTTTTSNFTANTGDVIYLDQIDIPGNPAYARLKNPDGSIILNDYTLSSGYYGGSGDRGPIQLKQSGTYTLEFTASYNNVSNYSLQIFNLASAATVSLDQSQTVNLDPSATTVYKFEGTVGQQISYDSIVSTYNTVAVNLYNAAGQVVSSAYDSVSDQAPTVLKEDGSYYIVFSNITTNARTVKFQLLNKQNATPITFDQTVGGNFVDGSEGKTFKISAIAGQPIFIDALNGSIYFSIYKPNGQLLDSSTLYDKTITLPDSGEYLIKINGTGASTAYQFRLTAPSQPVTPLTLGQVYNSAIAEAAQFQTYTFTGTAGQRVYLDGINGNGIYGYLYNPDGSSALGYSYSSPLSVGLDQNSSVIILPTNGTYTLKVVGYNYVQTGAYKFALWDVDANAETVALNTQTSDLTLQANQVKFLKFTADAGQFIFVEKNSSLSAIVYDSTGQPFTYRYGFGTYNAEEFTVPVSGTYVLALQSSADISTRVRIVTPSKLTDTRDPQQPISGTIAQPGEQDFYTFTGATGDRFIVDNLVGSDKFQLTIQTPSGETVYDRPMDSEAGSLFTLKEAGQYRITIDGKSDTTGNYGFRLLNVADSEPLLLDQMVTVTLNPASARKAYQFSGTAGQRLYFDQLTGWSGVNWAIYGAGNQLLAESYYRTDLEVSLPTDGQYLLVITGATNATGIVTPQFKVWTPAIVTTDLTPQFGQIVSGTIIEAGQTNIYTFDAKQGQRIFLDELTRGYDITAILRSPSGSLITLSEYSQRDSKFVSLNETGRYELIFDSRNEAIGSYKFRFLSDLDQIPLIQPAVPVNLTWIEGNESYLYRIQGKAGQRLYIDAPFGNYNVQNAYFDLYGADGEKIVSSYDYAPDIQAVLPQTGNYWLAIRSQSLTAGSNYSFTAFYSTLRTETLNFGQVTTGQLAQPGDRKEYAFSGVAGQQIWLEQLTNDPSIVFTLITPSGANIYSSWLSASVVLKEAGTYRVLIDGDRDAIGNYRFRLSNFAAATLLTENQPISGQLNLGSELATYRIEGNVGQQLTFDWQGANTSDLRWSLYGPTNQLVTSPTGNIADFTKILPLKGTYTLVLQSSVTTPVNYTFAVTRSVPTVQNTGFGVIYSGNIINTSQVDRYTFTAIAGTRVYIDSLDVDYDNAGIGITRPDGTLIYGYNATYDNNLLLDQSGTYTVSFAVSSPADYRVRIIELPFETPDPRGNERSLQLGVPTRATIEGNGATVYSFTGKVGQVLRHDGLPGFSGSTNDVTMNLVSPSGQTVWSNGTYYGGVLGDTDFYALPEAGTYNLLLQNTTATAGDVRFQILDAAEAELVSLNRKVTGSLPIGSATKLYRFQGKAGQRIRLSEFSGTNIGWNIYRPGDRAVVINGGYTNTDQTLLQDGEYIFAIIGNSTGQPLNYTFNLSAPQSDTAIITPGSGENSNGEPLDNPIYQVQIAVEDGHGGQAKQSYQVRVGTDPSNTAPTITSTPPKNGFTDRRLVYQVEASDANGDNLTYLLAESPAGMLIDSESGKITWTTPILGTHRVKVRVDDRRGGIDIQTFEFTVAGASGRITGTVYVDIDADGKRKVTNPGNLTPYDQVTIGDGSQSGNRFKNDYAAYALGRPDGVPGILGGAAFKDENTLLLGGGAASEGGAIYNVRVQRGEGGHIIGFDQDAYTTYFGDAPYNDASIVQLPGGTIWANQWPTSGVTVVKPGGAPYEVLPNRLGGMAFVPAGFPGAGELKAFDAYNGSGFRTVNYVLNGTYADGTPRYSITSTPSPTTIARNGPGGFIYMPQSSPDFAVPHMLVSEWNVNQVASYELDGDGNPIARTREVFIDGFNGAWGAVLDPSTNDLIFIPWSRSTGGNIIIVRGLGQPGQNEAGLKDWVVYVDSNLNGVRDTNEQFTYTDAKGDYSFDLAAGIYRIREEVQRGWTQTNPLNPMYWDVTIAAGDVKFAKDFGDTNNRLAGANVDPEFISQPPANAIKTSDQFVYRAAATDLNGDPLTYDLVVSPKGMAIAPNGTLSWRPGDTQIGQQQVIVRVQDGRGGIALQSFQIQVNQGNRAPIFTSTLPTINPKVGKEFQFQSRTIDLDGDTVRYEIIPDTVKPTTPAGATIDATTGLVKWTPTAGQIGGAFVWAYGSNAVEPWEVLIRAYDSKGGESFQRLKLTVDAASGTGGTGGTSVNQAPVITSKPRTLTGTAQPYIYEIVANDPDGDALTYELLAGAPLGMTLTGRTIAWTPTVAQLGSNSFQVKVSDGRGGTRLQTIPLLVANQVTNHAPVITDSPSVKTEFEEAAGFQTTLTEIDPRPKLAIAGQVYAYDFKGLDPDGDIVAWTLLKAPVGMVIDGLTGALRWQPNLNQIGGTGFDVVVALTDANGASDTVTFKLIVNGTNLPPQITSSPLTSIAAGQIYQYAVQAKDPENGVLSYALAAPPIGMVIDAQTGIITWTPIAGQVGNHDVTLIVTDALGASVKQLYMIKVLTANDPLGNRSPVISSNPVFLADPAKPYTYQVVAADPDAGAVLSYSLVTAPTGMTINPTTGLVTWTNPTAAAQPYEVIVKVLDQFGLGVGQGYRLTVRSNNAPVIVSTSPNTVALGTTYRYDVRATDADGDALTYALNQAAIDRGILIDSRGRISWTPKATDLTNPAAIVITVTDTQGAVVTQSVNLQVVADTEAPKVILNATTNLLNVGQSVTFEARATDNVGVAGLTLMVNGRAVALNGQGRAIVQFNTVQTVTATATAIDGANNATTSVPTIVDVVDRSLNFDPVMNLDLSLLPEGVIKAPTPIRGSVGGTNFARYELLISPLDTDDFKVIAAGNAAVTNGVLGTVDPSLLLNDTYRLRLVAYGSNGSAEIVEDQINIEGELKLGNFRLSFTDLAVPVTGIPISLTRTYDTLTANQQDDFGYGWRMEFRDTDLRTSLGKRSEEEEELGRYPAFKDNTKVFITLPGGKREAYTFKAKRVEYFQEGGERYGTGNFANYLFEATFESEKGSTNKLTVEKSSIFTHNPSGSYSGFQGQPFNPADNLFGEVYVLTSKDGSKYRIDAATGDLLEVKDTNGNTLTYSDSEIKSSTGQKVTFERDAQGRIVAVKDPMGELLRYGYDAQGDLVSVTDREQNTTRMVYDTSYDDPTYPGIGDVGRVKRSHYLREIIDPLGRVGARSEYDEVTGRLKQITDVYGKATNIEYDLTNSKQTVKDQLGYATTYVYDDRGNVLSETDIKGGTTTRTYDIDNNLLTETDADGVITKYTYDGQRNMLTIEDEHGDITRMTYDDRGRTTSIASPTGLTVKAKYDSRGNLLESVDTDGLKSTYEYNANGQIRFQKAPDGQVTEYDYDRFGNPNKMVDSRGNATTAVYDANGHMSTASSTFQVNGQSYTLGVAYVYDKEGRTTESRNSRGHLQKMVYDKLSRVTSTTDVLGNVTTFRHDIQDASIGQLIGLVAGNRSVITRVDEVTMPDNTPGNSADNPKMIRKYDQANRLVAEISPTGLETRYIYDELGRLIETIIPDITPNDWTDNPRLKREYTAGGRLKAQTDIYGNWERYEYDDVGQTASVRDVLNNLTTYTYTDGGQVSTVTDPRNRKTQYRYDLQGKLEEALFFDNTKYRWTYDELARVKTETNELGQKTTYEYDQYSQVNAVINALDERTEFKYNDRRKLIEVKDALGQVTRYKYDQFANHTETAFHNGDSVSMGYDGFDRMTSMTDARQFTTNYRYNNLSQLTEVEQANTAKTNYTYDTLGRMVAMRDANQRTTDFEYDAFNRVVADKLPLSQRNRSVYDKFGRLESATDFNNDTINYQYDAYGRVNRKTFTDPRVATLSYTYDDVTSQLKTVTDGRGITAYDYDNRDRLFKTTQPDTQYVQYGYDVLSNVTSVKTNAGKTDYGYDKLNRLDTVKDGSKVLADYNYDAAGNLIRTKFANSSVETRTYDGRNRLKSLTTKNVVGVTFSGFEYVLDGAGNRTKVTDHDGRVVDYQYDSVNRLTQEKVTDARLGNRTADYVYDLVGNRMSKADTLDGTTTYAYDWNDRLLSTTKGAQVTQFTYDNNGSMKTRSNATQTLTYDWINDGENRLIGVSDGTNQTQYIYDAFGERVATIAGGTRTNYLSAPIWGLPEVLMEYDNAGNITADYVHGNGTVRSRRDNREVYHHTDGLGSTRALTDTVGLVTDRYTFDAYGGLLEHQGTFGNSFQFAGEQRDSATGLDYLRARYYDSQLGRFISADAFAGSMGDPMSLHNYQYAFSNPTRYTDPSGYFPTLAEMSAAIQIAAQYSLVGSLGFGAGYIIGSAISGRDVIPLFGDFAAGFASGFSGGMINEVYENYSGKSIQPQDGILHNTGWIAGLSASILSGAKFATWAKTGVGAYRWAGIAGTTADVFSEVYGYARTTQNTYYAAKDGWQWEDNLNLLGYVPLAVRGVSRFIAGAKAAKAPKAESADINIKNLEETNVKAGEVPEAGNGGSSPGKTNCFVAGTEILTPEGFKNIEDIKIGDWVIADDPTTPGDIEARQVTDTFVRHADNLVDLYIDGEVISTTEEHPFWTPDRGWLEAKNLSVGALVQLEDGRVVDVDKIEKREGNFAVYNFNVEGFHTYYVSGLGILVHNANYDPNHPNRIDIESLDRQKLAESANQPYKGDGDLTVAGRALDKHANGQRGDSPFPALSGNNAAKSQTAQRQVDEILNHPDAVATQLGRGGTQIMTPDGRGIRFNQDGSLSGFID